MKLRNIFIAILGLTNLSVIAAGLEVKGSRTVAITPAASTGLASVIVVENTDNATLSYTAASAAAADNVSWYRFSSMGGAYAEPITEVSRNGATSSIKADATDMGYLIEESGRQTAYWIVNYANHYPTLLSFSINPDSDCDRVLFTPVGDFNKITYYSINGAPTTLDREITLEYNDLEMQADDEAQDGVWKTYTHTVDLTDITGTFSTSAPLCDTQFHLTGDRFLKAWGNPVNFSTDTYHTKRVEARTWAIQDQRENSNEQNSSTSGLGGSAPVDITFRAVTTDAVAFREWQFSQTEDFSDVINRFTEDEFVYTFTEYGTTYVRFFCADASGDCSYEGDVYTVMIGESKLRCPNAFSPQNQDGVNDEWKVSYSSLVSYDCHIFNRWGQELFHSTNPADGWDGRAGGKFVPSGVYFYVIKAEGADGVKYNISGDINIVGSKLKPGTESPDI